LKRLSNESVKRAAAPTAGNPHRGEIEPVIGQARAELLTTATEEAPNQKHLGGLRIQRVASPAEQEMQKAG
jgi:hypothetical protein